MKFYAHTASNEENKVLYSFTKDSGVSAWQGTAEQFLVLRGRNFSKTDLAEHQSGWQPLEEHLRQVAALAAEFVRPVGLAEAAAALGWLHDLGKYHPEFQRYLRGLRGRGEDTRHAIHGAALLLGRSDRALVQAIAGHHAGLHNWSLLEPCVRDFQANPALREAFAAWRREVGSSPKVPAELPAQPDAEAELRQRLLLSALVDADRLDTEAHQLAGRPDGVSRKASMSVEEMARRLEGHLAKLRQAPAVPATELTRLRQQISDDACAKGQRAERPGVFSLTVPTGGGKTLASLRFALQHALRQGFQRVIYVIPFTSIIEQNAQVFAGIFGAENVLEHHSLATWRAVDDPPGHDEENENDLAAARKRLAAENWDASLIVTTNVQFFESLLSHRPSPCRKLHRLLNSVVIFDECQAFPPGLLDPTLRRLQALAALGRTSLVLCTATPPAFRRRPAFPEGFAACEEIMPDAAGLARQIPFQRARIVHDPRPRPLADLCAEWREEPRFLAIFNTRRDAARAFGLLRGDGAEEGAVFHLSTLLCPRHRARVLARIKTLLDTPGARCRVVSTQLVEAGVDIDFPLVCRALGPLDSIIQAAGRCNREGKLPDGPGTVRVFQLSEENLPGGTYRRGRDKAPAFLERIGGAPYVEPEVASAYFAELYPLEERDGPGIAQLSQEQCYRSIGENYHWIADDTQPVVTDYGEEGRALQEELRANPYVPPDRKLLRRLGPFSINLRNGEVQKGLQQDKIELLHNGLLLTQHSYEQVTGYNLAEELPGDVYIC